MSNKQTNTVKFLALISFILLVLSIFIGYYSLKWRISYQKLDHKYVYSGEVLHPKTTQEIIDVTFSSDEMVQELHQMLKDTTELFEKFGIRNAIIGGTGIGIVRHGGLIPWDNDVDMIIMQEEEQRLIQVAPELEKLGYEIVWDDTVYRIFSKNKEKHPGWEYALPAIDLFVVFKNKEQNTIEALNWGIRKAYPDIWFPVDKFFPLKKYKFGPIEVYSANNIEWWVKHFYGENALKELKIYPQNWLGGKHSNIITVPSPAPDVFFKPALPKKPLLDNVR